MRYVITIYQDQKSYIFVNPEGNLFEREGISGETELCRLANRINRNHDCKATVVEFISVEHRKLPGILISQLL